MSCLAAPPVNWSEVKQKLIGKPEVRAMPPWVKLPSPPVALLHCMRKAQEPDVAPCELARIIERDAGLTCQILRRVNAAAEGFAQPARTIDEALVRLGVRRTAMYLLTEGMQQAMRSGSSKLLNLNNFAASNLERGLFAKRLARHMGVDDELAFASALIADCLLPVVTNQASRTYLRFLEGQLTTAGSLVEFEKKEFGWTHPFTTATIFSSWGFPDELVCAVALHHCCGTLAENPLLRQTTAMVVAMAALLPEPINQEPDGLLRLQRLLERFPGFDLTETARLVEQDFQMAAPDMQNPFPLSRRLARRR